MRLKVIRDLINLREENTKRFSKALSFIVLDNFQVYLDLLECIELYDSSSGGAKTSKGYKPLPESFDSALQDALISYVKETNE